jgi:hypothetical protein
MSHVSTFSEYVCKVSFQFKPYTLAEFASTLEKEIVPLLRKQGFEDEITVAAPGSTEVLAFRRFLDSA